MKTCIVGTKKNIVEEQDVLKELVQTVISKAQKKGAEHVEVGVSFDKGFSANVRLGELESVEYDREKNLALTVYQGKRRGSVGISEFSEKVIDDAIDKALSIASFVAEDPFAGLPEKSELAFEYPDLDLYHRWDVSLEKVAELAKACEAEAMAYDKRITNSEGAHIASHESANAFGNSLGFVGAYCTSWHELTCQLIAKKGDDMERDYDYACGRYPNIENEISKVAISTAKRTLQRLGARKLDTQDVPVLFVPERAAGLIGNFLSSIRGGAIYRKSSFMIDKVGEQCFPSFVTLSEKPHIKGALASAPFDDEGVRTRDKNIVENGVLQTYLLSTYSANQLKLKTTGNAGGVHNLVMSHQDASFVDLLKQMDKGLVVTEMMGQGVNLVTGNYSRGASGFWVENGEIQYPVHEVTIAGNLKDMFANVVAVGNDVDPRLDIQIGSMLIEEMTVAGK
ncbi:MAG: metalloprotease PmbA [Gammaproteobacteria bacterium]